ncbi:alpha/beta fold hydrolase [Nocardia sp. NPDC051052]|uniref:alpha/beta fold hydrolase n=1 Tax=Nocardia sp. NPDC051052 TaxID=3364322 RepID=UPI0037B300E8
MRVRQWRDGGRQLRTRAGSVFVRSAPGAGPTVVLLHGYPSSSYDFREVVERLGGRAWLAIDFLGFGLSEKPRPHHYSLFEQADIVEEAVAATVTGSIVLLAHDMGTSVATELLARDIDGALTCTLDRAVLSNGSVILEKASLRPIQKILRGPLGPVAARLANRPVFTHEFAQLFSAAHPLTKSEAEAQWELLSHAGGHRIAHLLTAYLAERVTHADRWHGAVRDWDKPLGFLWGTADPVATVAVLDGLRALRPAATVVELPGLGHYPQLEDPEAFAAGARLLLDIDNS